MADMNGKEFQYVVRRSSKAKQVVLRVDQTGTIRLVLPRWVSLRMGEKFFEEKLPWIRKVMGKRQRIRLPELISGTQLPFFGEVLQLDVVIASGRSGLTRQGSALVIKASSKRKVRVLIETWYRRQAKDFFKALVQAMKVNHVVVRISGAKTRWGSCNSKRRSLMFNWRLSLAPVEIARYVVIHEVVHLSHPNHSTSFWQAVALLDPQWQEHRAWLKEKGRTLVLWV